MCRCSRATRARSTRGAPTGARAPPRRAQDHAVHVVVLRRPARDRVPRLGLHRLHQHRRPGQARRVQPRDGPEAAADAVPRARGRRPQQPEPRLLPQASSTRSRPSTPATSTRATATAGCSTASPSATAAPGAPGAPTRTIPLDSGCGLGYTYPNPVVSGKRLYLFMRGPCWYPYYTSTTDGKTWTRAEDARARPARRGPQRAPVREVRRRARRLDPDDVLRRAPGLVQEQPLLHALQERPLLQGRRHRDRDARATCRSGSQPARHGAALLGARRAGRGRWTSRSARTACRRSSTRAASATTTTSATRAGTARKWVTRLISEAGGSLFGYRNGGITFNHADPNWVVLTRLIDGAHEIELRHTPDQGRTWEAFQLTRNSKILNFRPVFPRGIDRSRPARGRLRVGRGVELPQLPHGGEHADRRRRPSRRRPRRRRRRRRRPVPTATPVPSAARPRRRRAAARRRPSASASATRSSSSWSCSRSASSRTPNVRAFSASAISVTRASTARPLRGEVDRLDAAVARRCGGARRGRAARGRRARRPSGSCRSAAGARARAATSAPRRRSRPARRRACCVMPCSATARLEPLGRVLGDEREQVAGPVRERGGERG